MKPVFTLLGLVAGLAVGQVLYAEENCWSTAGARYRVDPWLLYSIAKKESNLNPSAVNKNSDGSEDVCMMQINSQHFPKLRGFGITREKLLNDTCLCINVGAWLVSESFYRYGVSWNSVGIYNAGPKKSDRQQARRDAYSNDVHRIYLEALGRGS